MNAISRNLVAVAALLLGSVAQAVPVTMSKLPGIVGGVLVPNTAIYKADLSNSGLASILSVGIRDNSSGLGGSGGRFSGFDLDGVKLSLTDCSDALCAKNAVGLSVFDFLSGVIFSPGAQRAPADSKLFGTDASGKSLDNAIATLGVFDGEAIADANAFGFLSTGDNGQVAFNLVSATSTKGLFLYIGEVGDNGEVAAGAITVDPAPPVPEPSTLVLFGFGLAGLVLRRGQR